MSIAVALIDFPKLQEQIAARLLAEYHVKTEGITHREAADRLSLFRLALFFWPDKIDLATERLAVIRKADPNHAVPLVLVTSESSRAIAQNAVGADGAVEILTTPLQPHVVSRKLAELLGFKRPRATSQLDVAYINPFVDGVMATLKQMAGMECTRTGLKVRTDAVACGDISGTMGLSGAADGFVSITFSNALARRVVCRMLQVQPGEETEEDVRDGVGEIMNMVAGFAKAELVNSEHSFQVALPQVIAGGQHSVGQPRGVPVISIQFVTENMPFEVMVCLMPRRPN